MCYCRCEDFAFGVIVTLQASSCYCRCEGVTAFVKLLLQE